MIKRAVRRTVRASNYAAMLMNKQIKFLQSCTKEYKLIERFDSRLLPDALWIYKTQGDYDDAREITAF